GIKIYASINTYSRFIPWIYIRISNSYAVSSIDEIEVILLYIRSDRGCEIPIVTNAYYILYKATGINLYQFSDLYWFGTSTANQRIEVWWGQVAKGILNKWKIFFKYLRSQRLYSRKLLPDYIAILFVYLPIIRE
ncbi:hypothetical protein F5882DRAFT_312027, partial [Hyaloscypha sp. PMI_1271]